MPNIFSNFAQAFREGSQGGYKDRIFRSKLVRAYKAVLIVLALIVLAIIAKLVMDKKVYTQVEVLSTMDKVGTQTSVYSPYNNNLLVYSKDGISAYSPKGEQLFNQTFEMQNPIVSINGDYVAVGDYKGNSVYVMDSTGPKGKVDTNKMIQSLEVSAGGVVSVLLDDGDVTWLNLYAQIGEIIT
ncbi:MAG: hypothetical protein J6P60_07255, partial [Lachnospiraceae bacterium]|nr:hypothetical protein [Lachnospiraceae bacterium]